MSQVLRIRNWLSSVKRALLRDWVAQDICSNAVRKGLRLEKLEDRELMAVSVSSFSPTPSGFTAQFTEEIRAANLNLFDAQNGALGAADVTLRGNSTGDIKGSLVMNGTSLSFIATGGALVPDTYTAVLKSGANAIVDAAAGQLLDGENSGTLPSGNGTPGGDFSSTFTVTSSALVVSLPDFARGPTQTVNVPAAGSGQAPQTGLPIRLSNAQGVTSLTLTLAFDSSLLNVSEVKLGRNAPTGSQVQSNLTVPGQATISFFALAPLASGAADIIELVATVPSGATYGKTQIIRLQNLEVNAGALQARADDAVHVVAYPGDANGNRRYDAEDARLIARVGVGLDTGFVLADPSGTVNNSAARIFPVSDPLIIGDVSGQDGLSPLDASDVLRRVAGLPTLNIPAIPSSSQAPTALSISSSTVAESAPIGTTIGNFTTTDSDVGDTFTYALVSGTGATDNASFTIVGNQLRTAITLNASTKSSYSVRVQTTDSTGNTFQQIISITVSSANRAPTSISLSNSSVVETASIGTAIGSLSAVDPDSGDTHTYTLVTGTGATDNASFSIVGASLRTATTLNAEAKSSYTVRVRATDAAGLFFESAFTITVSNANEAPISIALSTSPVPENVAIGTSVGTLSTTDPDVGDTHVYTLVSGTGSTDNALFTVVGGQLQTVSSLNFETKSSYEVRVRSTDAGGLFIESAFLISVTNVNEAPTSIALSNSSIAETASIGTAIGTLSTVDPDSGDTHTYSFVTGTGSTDNASFSIVGASLRTATTLNFETKSSYTVRVRSTDAAGLFVESALTITVTNVNAAPTAIALSTSSVAENAASGTAVGNLSTTDPDAGDTFVYTLVSGTGSTDNASFTIVGGQLRTASAINFETKSSYTVRVRSTDAAGLFVESALTITVTNVNEAPTAIALSTSSVAENAASGTTVGSLSTTDPDAGDTFVYTLVSGTGSTDNTSFAIVGGQLQTASALNFETKSSYTVRVRSTDAAGLFVESALTITVTNANETPTAIALSTSSVAENAASGTTVGNLSTTDPDAGDTFVYTLVSGTGSTDNASFTIVGGQLQTAAAFNFETKSSYTVRVRSTDAAGLFVESALTITVTNVNEAPTAIALSTSSVAENAASGTTVGSLSTTDPDAGDTFVYTLVSGTGSTDNASFTIVGGQLQTAAAFNFETKSSYTVRVRSTDAAGLFVESALAITVTNVNETPTAIALSTSSVAENAASGTTVGNLSTTDPDAGDTFVYSLVSGTGSTDNASFTIVGGQLQTAAAFNFETKSSYTVRVRSTDAAGLFVESALAITVTNVNETPTAIALSTSSVAENAASGTTVGNLSTTDPDAGDTFVYTLVSGTGSTDNGSFTIVGGQLQTAAAFDFETKSSYQIRVRSTDAGGLFVDAPFVISVTNANEAPTAIALSNNTVAENSAAGTSIGTLSTTDVDSGDTHTYTLVAGTGDSDNAAFALVANSIQTLASLDFETKSSYSVRVRSTDANGLFVERVLTLSVTNVNDDPTSVSLSNAVVSEVASIGTVIGSLSAVDADSGDTHTFALVAGTGDDDNGSFSLAASDLQTGTALNAATKSTYTIRVRATDAGGLFTDSVLVITVSNTNAAPTSIALSSNTVAENVTSGTTIGSFSTVDPDVGDFHSQSLVSGTGDDDNASFAIVGGQLQTVSALNFETKSTYTVRVRSTDAGGLFVENVFVVTVTNINEAPTAIGLSNSSVVNNPATGTVVGQLSSTDPDAGDSQSYGLVSGTGDTDNASFAIVGNELRTSGTLDFGLQSSYSVRVRSTDAGGLTVQSVFVITETV